MGTGLIFPGLPEVTDGKWLYLLNGLEVRCGLFQEITPAYRPYPKPTQVDR